MIDHTFYRFLSACQGSWRNSVYISTDGPGYLLSANRDGQPIVMAVELFQRLTMEDITYLLAPRNLPPDLGELGTVTEAELAMPGVYDAILEFLETGLAVEAFIVLSSAEEISAAAKRYGKTDPNYPNLLVYSEDKTGNTRYIVGYELFRYKILHHLPLPKGETIRSIAAAGAEQAEIRGRALG